MCGAINPQPIRQERLRDALRGRHSNPMRFFRLREYATVRWTKSREIRYARQWVGIIESIQKRMR